MLKKESYTGTRPLLFPAEKDESTSDSNLEALPSKLFVKMCEVPAENPNIPVNSNRYFRWETKEAFTNTVKRGETLNLIRNRYNSALYGNVAAYYDLADQYIGSNVQYVKLTLNAK